MKPQNFSKPPRPTPPPKACRNHPSYLAKWQCDSCGAGYCAGCVKRRDFQDVQMEICPQCGGRCLPLVRTPPRPPEPTHESFLRRLLRKLWP